MREYQMVYNIHLHGLMNTVSFLDGHKYCGGLVEFRSVCATWSPYIPGFTLKYEKGILITKVIFQKSIEKMYVLEKEDIISAFLRIMYIIPEK